MLYLLLLGIGTVLGMAIVTTLIALPVAYSAEQFAALNQGLRVAAAVLSLRVGLFLAYEIALADGLFTADPQRSPKCEGLIGDAPSVIAATRVGPTAWVAPAKRVVPTAWVSAGAA